MLPNKSPEFEPPERQQKRIEQIRHMIGGLISEREIEIETESAGLRLSLQDGLSVYLHVGNEDISSVQELNVLSPDTLLEVSFEPHSFDGQPLGVVARSIYRIGKKGIRIARKTKRSDVAEVSPDQPASDTDSLQLTTAIGSFFYKKEQ